MIRLALAMGLLVFGEAGTLSAPANAQEIEPVLIDVQPGERGTPDPAKFAIYKPKHMLATDAGQLVEGFLGDAVTVRVEPTGNTLLIRAAESELKEVKAILETLDQPPKQIAFEVLFVDLPATANEGQPQEAQGDSEAAWLARIQSTEGKITGKSSKLRLTATENQKAMVQFGEQTPVATGVQAGFGPRGGAPGERTATIRQTATGTIVQCTARVLEDGSIIAELDLERSRLAPESSAVLDESDDRGMIRTPGQLTTTCKTTVKLEPGKPRIISGLKSPQGNGTMFNLIVITAEITTDK
jgi:type II secretory pathway component GspD/PulD (secretin)